METSVILLAGGVGTRMNLSTPKQFLSLNGKPIARYSFDIFLSMNEVKEIVVVCTSTYHSLFTPLPFQFGNSQLKISFAEPGERRQDSVYNGFKTLSSHSFVCVHDAARPFITQEMVRNVLNAGNIHGAATVAMPVKFTVKESDEKKFVQKTLNREQVWEIQTPQILSYEIMKKGFDVVHSQNLSITDDVALSELLHNPVKLVEGTYSNLKITTQEDLAIAQALLTQQNQPSSFSTTASASLVEYSLTSHELRNSPSLLQN